MTFNVYRVLADGERWVVRLDGSPESARRFSAKAEAIAWGREEAEKNRPSQLVVQLADGTIEGESDQGEDPGPGAG